MVDISKVLFIWKMVWYSPIVEVVPAAVERVEVAQVKSGTKCLFG
jgi:hypothetical protein